MASVFARLKVPAADGSGAIDDQGVHAFIVPLRDPSSKQLLPGVEIHDNAYKVPRCLHAVTSTACVFGQQAISLISVVAVSLSSSIWSVAISSVVA